MLDHPFVCASINPLYYFPGTVLSTRDIIVNMMKVIPASTSSQSGEEAIMIECETAAINFML